jgi:hypothetical protein
LDESIQLQRKSLYLQASRVRGHANNDITHDTIALGSSLLLRHAYSGYDVSILNKAIAVLGGVVDMMRAKGKGDHSRIGSIVLLRAMIMRYRSAGNAEDLDQAITFYEQWRKDPRMFVAIQEDAILHDAGCAFLLRYSDKYQVGDLDNACACFSKTLRIREPGH